ncbi:MAG: AMP-binding protein [Gammaproteobacteria bacterium]|nr:AMP-binding protein [Gammaproteobacteria bacterium]
MPKTIAITPSWYWPESVDRVVGIPPFGVTELCVERHAREHPQKIALISKDGEISFGELQQRVAAMSESLMEKKPESRRTVLSGELSISGIVRLFGALSAGYHIRLLQADEDHESVATRFGSGLDLTSEEIPEAAGVIEGRKIISLTELTNAAVAIKGKSAVVNHSHRSLLAGTISMVTFLQPQLERSWLASLPLDRWEGLLSVMAPLYLGAPLAISNRNDPEGFAEAVQQYQPGYAISDLTTAALATREAKGAVKKARDILDSILLSTAGVFNPGDRQRVAKSFRCASLTMFGLAETGAIFASHPQWYLDESVGIPLTNAHVVPSDPRNGAPIQALWELVESAEVTVKGPMLMCGYEDADNENHFVDGRFRTGVIASSDANGMIYILPD